MKKKSILFNVLGAFLCATTPAAADFCGQNYSDCCEWSVLDGKVTLGADWLYWHVQQDGLLPGAIVVTDAIENPPTVFTETIRPKPRWESGFRVNLGYELPCDCWDVNICYTYMPSHVNFNRFVRETEFQTFAPSQELSAFSSVLEGGIIAAFGSKWNITINNIDLDFGRSVCFGECLTVRPHVGFRATWFDQKFRSFVSFAPIDEISGFAALSMKEKFEGYGVEAGIWSDYKLGCGLSLVGHFGGSILYSKYRIHRAAIAGVNLLDLELLSAQIFNHESHFTATPSLDYFAGLQYADTMCDMIFQIRAGWEQHVLFDTNRLLRNGNLSAQGLTLSLDVSF